VQAPISARLSAPLDRDAEPERDQHRARRPLEPALHARRREQSVRAVDEARVGGEPYQPDDDVDGGQGQRLWEHRGVAVDELGQEGEKKSAGLGLRTVLMSPWRKARRGAATAAGCASAGGFLEARSAWTPR
jgi:hypothetical protein